MNLSSYVSNLKNDLPQRATCFLVKDRKVLLGKKKEGIGNGNFVGIGGKIDKGEELDETIMRELKEEIKVVPTEFHQVAELDFLFLKKKNWNQKVNVFICDKWKGEPEETDEILPEWYDFSKLPYKKMWEDARYYLQFILIGRYVKGQFLYNGDQEVVEAKVDFKKL